MYGWMDGERKEGEGKTYLDSRLREHLVLLQDAGSVLFVRDLEEGDAFDGGHFLQRLVVTGLRQTRSMLGWEDG